MSKHKFIQELVGTGVGTKGTLLIPAKIFDVLIPEVSKRLIPRSEAARFAGPTLIDGSDIDFDLQVENAMDVREIAEGAEIWIDDGEWTVINSKPRKYGVGLRITREMMEDSKFDLMRDMVQTSGRRIAENENSLTIAALDGGANTVSGGAAVTIANITRAIQHLRDADYEPTTLLIGMEILNDLQNIDTFVEADKLGTREMLETGFVGVLYGMRVFPVSTNAGMTTTTAYVLDRGQAYGIAEKRTLMVENFDLPAYDMSAASVTQRISVSLLRSNAVAIITTS